MFGASIWKNKNAVSSVFTFWMAMTIILAIVFLAGGVMLGDNFGNFVKSDSFKLKVSMSDSETLMLEHMGGDAISFTEDTRVYLCFDEEKLELSSDCGNTLLEAGGLKKFIIPDDVKLKKGDSTILKIVDEKRKREIYRKEIHLL